MYTERTLILGSSGQDGQFLTDSLLKNGHNVLGLSNHRISSINPLNLLRSKQLILNVENFDALRSIILDFSPNSIYNLSAQSSVMKSFIYPSQTYGVNVGGLLNTLNIVKELGSKGLKIKIFHASSSEMFGTSEVALDEASPMLPISPYANSKYVSHLLIQHFRTQFGLRIVNGIMFNHESELRPNHFVTQKIIEHLVSIKFNLLSQLPVGNLQITRDWGYAPEYVEAIVDLMSAEIFEDFVIATGVPHSLYDFINITAQVLQIHRPLDEFVTFDESLKRKSDLFCSFGNPNKIKNRIGWQSRTDFESLILKLIRFRLKVLNQSNIGI